MLHNLKKVYSYLPVLPFLMALSTNSKRKRQRYFGAEMRLLLLFNILHFAQQSIPLTAIPLTLETKL